MDNNNKVEGTETQSPPKCETQSDQEMKSECQPVLENMDGDRVTTNEKVNESRESFNKKIMLQELSIRATLERMVEQPDGALCGIYAIAVCEALCRGIDPTTLLFTTDRYAMRDHLRCSLMEGVIRPFPMATETPACEWFFTYKVYTKGNDTQKVFLKSGVRRAEKRAPPPTRQRNLRIPNHRKAKLGDKTMPVSKRERYS